MFTLTVSLSTLRAARTHSADKDIRSYLCGVYLDTAHGFVVATDGHRMLTAVEPGVRLDGAAPVIIPNDTVDAALKQFAGEYGRGKPLGAVDVSITVDNLDAARAAVQAVLDDPAASRWLKGALDGAMLRDPIDAAADADKLSRLLREYAGALQLAAAQAVRS